MAVRVLRSDRDSVDMPILAGEGQAGLIVGRTMGARYRGMGRVLLPAGAATTAICYQDSECVYYVASGTGEIEEPASQERAALKRGSMILVPSGVAHVVRSAGEEPLVLIGGPCPPGGTGTE